MKNTWLQKGWRPFGWSSQNPEQEIHKSDHVLDLNWFNILI